MIFLLSCFLSIVFSQPNFTPDLVNTIKLPKNINFLKQLSNSSIFIQYDDGTCYMYESSFKKINQLDMQGRFLINISISDQQQLVSGYITGSNYFWQYSLITNKWLTQVAWSAIPPILSYVYQTSSCYFYMLIVQPSNILISQQFKDQSFNQSFDNISLATFNLSNLKHFIKIYLNSTCIYFAMANVNNYIIFELTYSGSFTMKRVDYGYIGNIISLQYKSKVFSIYYNPAIYVLRNSMMFIHKNFNFVPGYISNKLLDFIYEQQSFYLIRSDRIQQYEMHPYYGLASSSNYSIAPLNLNAAGKTLFQFSSNPNQLQFFYSVGSNILYQFSRCHNQLVFNKNNGKCEKRLCTVQNCVSCYFAANICTTCSSQIKYHHSVNLFFQCQYLACFDNCVVCQDNLTCFECSVGYYLNQLNSSCILINSFVADFNYSLILPDNLNQQFLDFSSSIQVIGSIWNEIIKFSFLRAYLIVFLQIFGHFDQFWYYIYQPNPMKNLTVIPNFFNFIFQVNKDRFAINFPGQKQLQNQVDVDSNIINRYMNFTNGQIQIIEQQAIYFQHNANNLIGFQIIFNLIIFFIIYLSIKLVDLIRFVYYHPKRINEPKQYKRKGKKQSNQNQSQKQDNKQQEQLTQLPPPIKQDSLFGLIYCFLIQKSNFKYYFVMIFQANLIFISFRVGLQLKLLFSFCFINKINVLLTLFYGFCAFSYSFIFYLLIQKIDQKTQKNANYLQSLNKTIIIGVKSIAVGFIQSVFIHSTQAQLAFLILIKFILIFFILFKPEIYEYKSLRLLKIIYYLGTSSVDIFLLLSKLSILEHVDTINVTNIQYSLIFIIVGSVILKTLIKAIFMIRYILIKLGKKQNKVSPQVHLKKDKIKQDNEQQNIIQKRCKTIKKTRFAPQFKKSNFKPSKIQEKNNSSNKKQQSMNMSKCQQNDKNKKQHKQKNVQN